VKNPGLEVMRNQWLKGRRGKKPRRDSRQRSLQRRIEKRQKAFGLS